MPIGKKSKWFKDCQTRSVPIQIQDTLLSKRRKVFICKRSIACCGRKEEHMNMKHPFLTTEPPQSSASLRSNLTVRKCWDSCMLISELVLRFNFGHFNSKNPDC